MGRPRTTGTKAGKAINLEIGQEASKKFREAIKKSGYSLAEFGRRLTERLDVMSAEEIHAFIEGRTSSTAMRDDEREFLQTISKLDFRERIFVFGTALTAVDQLKDPAFREKIFHQAIGADKQSQGRDKK